MGTEDGRGISPWCCWLHIMLSSLESPCTCIVTAPRDSVPPHNFSAIERTLQARSVGMIVPLLLLVFDVYREEPWQSRCCFQTGFVGTHPSVEIANNSSTRRRNITGLCFCGVLIVSSSSWHCCWKKYSRTSQRSVGIWRVRRLDRRMSALSTQIPQRIRYVHRIDNMCVWCENIEHTIYY